MVLRAPGTNCDLETAWAFAACGAMAERVHLFRLLEQPAMLAGFQILCVPGGFSFGDDVGAGVVFGAQLRWRLSGVLLEFLAADKLVLGICNGFQVLMKARILPGGAGGWPPSDDPPAATLTWNDNGRYTARWVRLISGGSQCVFLRGIDQIELPMAHAEGKVAVRDAEVLRQWQRTGQIALRYEARDNPNGSIDDVAGLCDPTGRVLGMMPHPERYVHATQHPHWTRRDDAGEEGLGLRLFRNAVEYFG
jgi:phosphoribosylformylglycinamidine synthase